MMKKKLRARGLSIALSATMAFSVFAGLQFGKAEPVSAAEDNWIQTEVESFNDAGSLNGGEEVLEEVSRILGEDYGSRLYGTKLAIGGADYITSEFDKYCDVAKTAEADAHYHPNNTSHPRYPGTIYPENHRINGVVEFGDDNTTASIAVGRAIPAYDGVDLSEYAGNYTYSNPPKRPIDQTVQGDEYKYFENNEKAYTGEFIDFGVLDANDESKLTLPDTATWTEEKDVYGAIKLADAIDAAKIAELETKIEALPNVGELTGLYIASTITPAALSAPYGGAGWYNYTMNKSGDTAYSIPYVLSDTWKEKTKVSAISMTESELDKVIAAGQAGKIKKSERQWPEHDYSSYGIIKAETDNPDLILLVSGHIDNVAASYGVVDDGGAIASEVELARRLSEAKKAGNFDNGNIEIIFAAVGGEEHSDFNGMYWVIDNLIKKGSGSDRLQKTINLNMDQVSQGNDPDWSGNSRFGMNVAYGFDETWHRGISLPLNLVIKNFAEFGKFDSQPDFVTSHDSPRSAHPGNDNAVAGSEYIENFSLNHGANKNYHSSLDTMDTANNYSLERHQYSTNVIHAAILRAVKDQVSKKATFNFVKKGDTVNVSLANAETMFKTYDKVTAAVSSEKYGSLTLEFTPEKNQVALPVGTYKIDTMTESYTDNSGIDKSGTRGGDQPGKVRSFEFDRVNGYISIDMNDPELKELKYTLAPTGSSDNPSVMKSDFTSKLVGEIKTSEVPDDKQLINIKGAKIDPIKDQAYSGAAKKPAVKVTLGGKTLVKDKDYSAVYAKNTAVGKATVVVTGKGAYEGSKVATFKIVPKTTKITSIKVGKRYATVKWSKVSGTTKYQVSYRVKGSSKWTTKSVSAKSSSLKIKKLKKGKTYQVRVRSYKTVSKVNYYSAWSAVKTSKKIK